MFGPPLHNWTAFFGTEGLESDLLVTNEPICTDTTRRATKVKLCTALPQVIHFNTYLGRKEAFWLVQQLHHYAQGLTKNITSARELLDGSYSSQPNP